MKENENKLWWLRELGLNVLENSGTELICSCPFCGDERKHFYLHSEKILYDCKKCSEQGNYLMLMSRLTLNLAEDFDTEVLARLASDRVLPRKAFAGYDFGWTGTFYTLPVRDVEGNINNVLRYKPGDKLRSAPDCKMGLFGAQHLADKSRKEEPVYILEGPWDAIALDWLKSEVEAPGIATAVLGAGNLPDTLIGFFKDRSVYVIQDNDEAGQKGEARIAEKLYGVARSHMFFRWEENEPAGKDIRDIIAEICNG